MAGGRGGANRIRVQASYNLSGSPFDAAPYPLTANTGEKPTYLNQRLTLNIGGPFKIPGIYKGRTGESFFLNYNGGFGGNLYEAYSIVPTAAWRAGDFSGSNVTLIDPLTGLPFPNNQIPASRIDPAALALLQVLPAAEPAGRREELLPLGDDGQPIGRHQLPVHEVVQRGAWGARRRGRDARRRRRPRRYGRRAGRVEPLVRPAVPADRRRSQQRVPDDGRVEQGRVVERAGELHLQPVGHVQHVERPVQPREVGIDEPLRVSDRRRRRARASSASRRIRSPGASRRCRSRT